MTRNPSSTRRDILRGAVMAAGALAVTPGLSYGAEKEKAEKSAAAPAPHGDWFRGLKVGIASYSFRKLPLDAAVKATQRVGLGYVSIKDFHLPLKSTADERKAAAAKWTAAGIKVMSCGVIALPDEDAACRNAFEYARDIGAGAIVCHPEPEALPRLEKLVKEFDIKIAIHNHGPEAKHFHSPMDAMPLIEKLDERMGLCIDVGHCARAGTDPVKAIHDCRARLFDMHMKDVTDIHGKNGSVEIEVGRGVMDIRGMLTALLEIKYTGHIGFEHERDPADPIPGVAESVGYVKGILAGLA